MVKTILLNYEDKNFKEMEKMKAKFNQTKKLNVGWSDLIYMAVMRL